MLSDRAAKNVVAELDKQLTWSDRLADKVAELNGSWSFIIGLSVFALAWMLVNLPGILVGKPPDAYPFQFFNLVLAILVALQGPLIVMSQNRQAVKDRATAETDFKVNLKNEVNIETILRELGEFRAEANGPYPHPSRDSSCLTTTARGLLDGSTSPARAEAPQTLVTKRARRNPAPEPDGFQ